MSILCRKGGHPHQLINNLILGANMAVLSEGPALREAAGMSHGASGRCSRRFGTGFANAVRSILES